MKANNKILWIVIGIIVIGAIIGAWLWFTQIRTQTVTVILPDDVTGSIYTQTDEHEDGEDENNPLATLTGRGEAKLTPGDYEILTEETEQYASTTTAFIVTNEPATVTVTPDFSATQLDAMLNDEQAAIQAAIKRDTPEVSQYYTIERGKLYQQGEWYATKLVYKGPEFYDSDTLRLVARQEDGEWRVVTVPPTILINTVVYPEIPREVAIDINSN